MEGDSRPRHFVQSVQTGSVPCPPPHPPDLNKPSQWITEVTFLRVNLMGHEDDVSLPSVSIQRLPGAILHSPSASRSTAPLITTTSIPLLYY